MRLLKHPRREVGVAEVKEGDSVSGGTREVDDGYVRGDERRFEDDLGAHGEPLQ